jgi:hypothetical protein
MNSTHGTQNKANMIEYNSFVNDDEEELVSWEMLLDDGDDAVERSSGRNTDDLLIDFDVVELVVSAASEAAFDRQFDLDDVFDETDSLKLVKRNVPRRRSTRRPPAPPSGDGEDSPPTSSTDVVSFEMEEEEVSYTIPLNFGDEEDEANDKNTTTTATTTRPPRRRKLVPRRTPCYFYQESSQRLSKRTIVASE